MKNESNVNNGLLSNDLREDPMSSSSIPEGEFMEKLNQMSEERNFWNI
jgi:hypothetical protein